MRDPTRIDRMIELLRKRWHESPDQRLGQLVTNYATLHLRDLSTQDFLSVDYQHARDPWNTEDNVTEANLLKGLK